MENKRLGKILIHVLGWLLFLCLPLLFLNSGNKSHTAWGLLSSPFYWLFALTYLVIFYINIWYLIPSFFVKKKYYTYAICVFALLSLVYFLQPFDKLLAHNPRFESQVITVPDSLKGLPGAAPLDTGFRPFGKLPHQDLRMQEPTVKPVNPLWYHSKTIDVVSLVLFAMITAVALSFQTTERWYKTEQKVIKAEAEKVSAELSFLKAQINPHFLFNTLNNIYSLSIMNSEHTSASIMKLSNIMRYVTDEVSQQTVPLDHELKCISDFIDLQRLRLGKKTQIEYTVEKSADHKYIPPLILMSFVENAFKYGISKKDNSIIQVVIKADEKVIQFTCSNQIFNRQPTERSGIGIANTRQRLQYLYPEKYALAVGELNDRFNVQLTLIGNPAIL